MFHKPVSGLSGIVLLVLCASTAAAQDFHVDTQIYDLHVPAKAAAKAPKPQLIGAAESLFHAGKVYDHTRGENLMTIYEPAQERFVIVDEGRNLKTTITFSEITDHLLEDRAGFQNYLVKSEQRKLPPDLIVFFRFQLKPDFHVKFTPDAKSPHLGMTSPLVEYHLECAAHDAPAAVQAYLEYADWAARLNFVTGRQAMLPAVRMAVNDELRRRKLLLPVKVTLHTHIPNGIHVRAEHKFAWQLNGFDKTTISHWDDKAAQMNKSVPWEKFFEPTPQTAKRN